VTGRTHQIRVHTQFAGIRLRLMTAMATASLISSWRAPGLSRLFLHAAALKFTHPNTGKSSVLKRRWMSS
jgi:23S rRNA pseudouridine955/2504/2580 synthase